MCNERMKTKIKIGNKIRKIDTCLESEINRLNNVDNIRTLASCCGHNIYSPTIFYKHIDTNEILEFYSGEKNIIPIKRKYLCFYIKDKNGFYFNPQIEKHYND